MSDYNFQQFTRDMAQAAQLSAANEAAKNSARLLEAQKQQAAIEQQKLQLDQIRLQEERARHEAAQNKLERHKAIRNAMAEMERILQSFTRDLASGRLNQIIGGLPLISFLGALTRRQLQMVTACKDELEDLSDIRFMGALQQSFADLIAARPNELSASALEKAASKVTEFAGWAGAYRNQYLEIEKDTQTLLESLLSTNEQQNTLDKIKSNLEQTESRINKISEIDAAAGRLWTGVESDIQALLLAGIGSEEIGLLTDRELDPQYPEFKAEICEVRNWLDESNEILQKSEALWHSDKTFVDQGLKETREGNWGAAESTHGKIVRQNWADFDAGQVEHALRAELKRLKEEIFLSSSGKKRVSLVAAQIQEYATSPFISDSLKKVYDREVSELAAKTREFRNAVVAVIVVGVLAFTCYSVPKIAAEKKKVAALERAEKAGKRQKEALEKGQVLLDEAGRYLWLISGGSFQMGSSERHDESVHSVSVGSFLIGETEVTYGEWIAVKAWANWNGYEFSNPGKGRLQTHPVTDVSWHDAVKWCNAKSQKERLTPCYKVAGAVYQKGEENSVSCNWNANGYRLPTEAEWEWAARGGLKGKRFPTGDSLEKKDANIGGSGTANVSKYPANGYGLYDMAGNVSEWCWDLYGPYAGEADPRGASTGSNRVLRGGDWSCNAFYARCAYRHNNPPTNTLSNLGFRLARGCLQSGDAGIR